VKLCLVQNLPQDVQYIALSHCWGLGPRFRLTTSSAGTFYEGIEVSALPKTFQDTIAVATKFRAEFGIRYVWIDSLCIVQDSLEDWRRESAIMGEIYQNAFCTVAATAAVDGSIGLFFQRQTWRILPCAIPVVPEDGAERMFYWTDPDDWTNSVSKAPLNQRSWVLQERLLSPRVLHFAADQLFWECSGLEASEVFPRGLPEGLGEQYKQWLRLVGTITVKDLRGTLRGAYGIWDQIVKTYSAGNLTEPTDRLVALSGIAHKMQEHLLPFDSYAAGLWRNDIPFGLLWDVKDPLKQDQSSNLVQHYIAPSWSWASRSGIVPGDVDPWASARSLINIKWARISAIGHDEMGQLNGGTIGLSCILIRAHLSRVYQPGSSAPGSALRLGRRLIGGAICRADEGFRFDVHLPTILYCLPIFQASGKYVTRCRGLLLIPSGRTREFRRYGTFTADAWNEEFLKSSDPHMFETGDLSANGRFDIMLI
jgi:Heterokaryon incompatibility protein (HET)